MQKARAVAGLWGWVRGRAARAARARLLRVGWAQAPGRGVAGARVLWLGGGYSAAGLSFNW